MQTVHTFHWMKYLDLLSAPREAVAARAGVWYTHVVCFAVPGMRREAAQRGPSYYQSRSSNTFTCFASLSPPRLSAL